MSARIFCLTKIGGAHVVPTRHAAGAHLRWQRVCRHKRSRAALIWQRRLHVEAGAGWRVDRLHAGRALHAHCRHSLHVLRGELSLAFLLALSERDVEWLAGEHSVVHLDDRFGRVVRLLEADEAEAF